jgi:hypothetical protein
VSDGHAKKEQPNRRPPVTARGVCTSSPQASSLCAVTREGVTALVVEGARCRRRDLCAGRWRQMVEDGGAGAGARQARALNVAGARAERAGLNQSAFGGGLSAPPRGMSDTRVVGARVTRG